MTPPRTTIGSEAEGDGVLDRIFAFREAYGGASLRLAAHAAVLERMRPDVVALLRRNFMPGADRAKAWLDSDVLNGPLTHRIGGGYYRMDRDIRRALMGLLDQMPVRGAQGYRSAHVARFIRHYAANAGRSHRLGALPSFAEYLREIGWVALGVDEPMVAARSLYGLMADSAVSESTGTNRIRLGGVAGLLSLPMRMMQDEVRYAMAQDRLADGEVASAQALLEPIAHRSFSFSGVDLPAPARLLERHAESRATSATRPSGDGSLGPSQGATLKEAVVKSADPAKDTPIIAAVRAGDIAGLIAALAAYPSLVDATDSADWTPLQLAALQNYVSMAQLLLDAKADMELSTSAHSVPLGVAACWGSLEVARLLLKRGAAVDARSPARRTTPLQAAAYYGHVEIVRLLLDADADLTFANADGLTPLLSSTNSGNQAIFDMLLAAGASVPGPGENSDFDAVSWAANGGNARQMARFIQAGWPIDRRTSDGWSPLLITTCRNSAACAELLLELGCSANEFNAAGWPALSIACHWNFPDVVGTLLRHGAAPNVRAPDGNTALCSAAEQDAGDAIGVLLEHPQIEVFARNLAGKHALNLAIEKKSVSAGVALARDRRVRDHVRQDTDLLDAAAKAGADFFIPFARALYADDGARPSPFVAIAYTSDDALEALIGLGASPDARDARGNSAIDVAIQGNRAGHLRKLLQAGASTGLDATVLHRAVRAGENGEVLAVLLDHGLDPNARGPNAETPLMRAAVLDRPDICRLLLTAGADVGLRNQSGIAALDRAVESGSGEVIALLLAAGADMAAPSLNPALTPLQRAASYGAINACQILLAAGTSPTSAAPGTPSPLELARANGHIGVVALILDRLTA